MSVYFSKWNLLWFVILVITACRNHSQDTCNDKIVISRTDYGHSYKLSEICEDIQIIPLETKDSCLVGECSKVTVTDEFIYILDSKSNQLHCFDRKGRFVRNIGSVGRAPDEYLSLSDYCILKNGNVVLLDAYPNKLLIYNNLNEIEVVQRLPFCVDALECLNDSIFVFNGSCYEDRVVLWNFNQKKRTSSFVKYDKRFCGRLLKTFTKVGDKVLWSREYHQELFRVEENSLTVGRKIDFGEHNFTGELVKGFMGLYFLPPGVAQIAYYTETPDYITLRFSCNVISEDAFLALHSKKTKRNIILHPEYFTDDLTYYFVPRIQTDTPDGRLVAVLETSWWLNHLEKIEENKQYEPENFNALKEKLKGVQFSDNPVVVIYQLKPF